MEVEEKMIQELIVWVIRIIESWHFTCWKGPRAAPGEAVSPPALRPALLPSPLGLSSPFLPAFLASLALL